MSVIDELPPGRKPIDTRVLGESKRLELLVLCVSDRRGQTSVCHLSLVEVRKSDLLAVTKGHELLEIIFGLIK